MCVCVCVCVFQPVCNAGKGDGQQGCVLLGICTFGGPSERPKKKKESCNICRFCHDCINMYV